MDETKFHDSSTPWRKASNEKVLSNWLNWFIKVYDEKVHGLKTGQKKVLGNL